MGADFYPRLTAVASKDAECNRLVNEQAEVGLLMAGPGILGTLTLAPLAITIFYRQDFGPAVEILRWICLGMLLKVVTWPMGFIILARGERKLFFWTEVLTNAGYVAFVWLAVGFLGLRGTGVAFCLLYAVSAVTVYAIVRKLTGFRWSAANKQLGLMFSPLVALVFVAWYVLPPLMALLVGAAVTTAAGLYSLRILCKLIPAERLPRPALRMFRMLKLMPSNTH
jgi:PST family polysaccharide transporter